MENKVDVVGNSSQIRRDQSGDAFRDSWFICGNVWKNGWESWDVPLTAGPVRTYRVKTSGDFPEDDHRDGVSVSCLPSVPMMSVRWNAHGHGSAHRYRHLVPARGSVSDDTEPFWPHLPLIPQNTPFRLPLLFFFYYFFDDSGY